LPGVKVTPPCKMPLWLMFSVSLALHSAGHEATMFGGGGVQTSAVVVMTRLQMSTAIKHARKAVLAGAAFSNVFMVIKVVSHSFPKAGGALQRKLHRPATLA